MNKRLFIIKFNYRIIVYELHKNLLIVENKDLQMFHCHIADISTDLKLISIK